MISIDAVAAFVEADLTRRRPPVGLYWYECEGPRSDVARQLVEAAQGCHVVPLIPTKGFDNPNALATDVVALLEEGRRELEPGLNAAASRQNAIALVVLSRTRLRDALVASPVTMPPWFPYFGAAVVSIDIRDVASEANASLREELESIASLQVSLYEVEGLLLERVRNVVGQAKGAPGEVLRVLLRDREDGEKFLHAIEDNHSGQVAEEFRVKTNPQSPHLLGRIVFKVGTLSPEQLPGFARSLFELLQLEPDAVDVSSEPFFALAFRSTQAPLEGTRESRYPRNTCLVLYAGAQVITAFHHSGEYGAFPVVVMRAALFDIRRCVNGFRDVLARSPSLGGT